jgi:hemolysin activation/secretion protein
MRSREKSVNGQITYEKISLSDHLDGGINQDYKDRHIEMMSVIFSGYFQDAIFNGGNTTWNLRSTFGNLIFDDKKLAASDLGPANTSGRFSKIFSILTHARDLGDHRELLINFRGQWTSRNLDSSQKMGAGGAYSVRAYASGAVSGDQGGFLSAELRQPLGFAWGGKWTAAAFVDSASLKVNKNTLGNGENNALLMGTGVGLTLSVPGDYSASAFIAVPLGSQSSFLSGPHSVQFSATIQKIF